MTRSVGRDRSGHERPLLPIRLGIVGGGMMSQIGHIPFYLADRRCELVAVAESRPSLASALAAVVGPGRVVPDHRQLLDDPSIDALVLSLPRPATGPLTLEALQAGKHLLVEKPMAHTAEQARRLVEAARARGLLYGVGYMKRFDPGVEQAKAVFDQLIAEGALGRLQAVRCFDFSKSYAVPPPPHTRPSESRVERFPEWPLAPAWLPPELTELYAWFVNAGCHDVNLLRLFFPDGLEVKAAHASRAGAVTAMLLAGEVSVTLDIAQSATGRWLEGAEFLFERGRLAVMIPSPMDVAGVTCVTLESGTSEQLPDLKPAAGGWAFARQAGGFLNALVGTCDFRNIADEGLDDMILIEDIWRAAVR